MIILKSVIAGVSVLALIIFGWGTYHQITGQADTNKEMAAVAQNIKKANELTVVTVERLQPLSQTAGTIQSMNGKLGHTAMLLGQMNQGLGRVTNSEQLIVRNLNALNGTTAEALKELKRVSGGSGRLVGSTGTMNGQVNSELHSLNGLGSLTDQSVAELRKLNQKLALLRRLP